MDIYPAILQRVREIENSSESNIYVYQTGDTPCSDFETFCNNLGIGVLAPEKKTGALLVYLQSCIQCPGLLENDGWPLENLDETDPKTPDEIVNTFYNEFGINCIELSVNRFINGENIALVQDNTIRSCFEDSIPLEFERAIIYQTPTEIADKIQEILDSKNYKLKINAKYIKTE